MNNAVPMSSLAPVQAGGAGKVAARAGGLGAAAELFAQLFAAEAGKGAEMGGGGSEGPGAGLSQLLNTLGRRALHAEGLAAEDAVEEVADMASDLADALDDLDENLAVGLLEIFGPLLERAGGGTEMPSVGAVDITPDTASAALDMFRSTLSLVGRALRAQPGVAGLLDGQAAGQVGPVSGQSGLFMGLLVAADAPVDEDGMPAVVGPEMVSAAEGAFVEGLAAESAAEAGAEGGDPGDMILSRPVGRAGWADAGAVELLGQIVAAAAGSDGNGAVASIGPRRRGVTAADVLSALPQAVFGGADVVSGDDAAVPAAKTVDPPRFAAVLADQVRAAEVSEGHTRIELNPRGLGALEVDVSTAEDGKLNVVVRAENPGVLSALRSGRELLSQALGDLGGGGLDLQSFSQGSDHRGSDQRRASSLAVAAPQGAGAGASGESVPTDDLIGSGRLNIVT